MDRLEGRFGRIRFVWLAAIALAMAATLLSGTAKGMVSRVSSTGGSTVIDLGAVSTDESSYGTPAAVDDSGDVLFTATQNGSHSALFKNGAWVSPPSSPQVAYPGPVTMNDSGVVVGWGASSAGTNENAGYWWNTATGATANSDLSGDTGFCGGMQLDAIDDAGEAGGIGNQGYANDTCGGSTPANGGVYASGFGDTATLTGTGTVVAINSSWEWVLNGSTSEIVNRSGGPATPVTVITGGGGALEKASPLGPDGSIAGSVSVNGKYEPAVEESNGTVRMLTEPGGGGVNGYASFISPQGTIFGVVGGVGELWTSPTAQPISFSSLAPSGSGWSFSDPLAVSADGWVVGLGSFNGSAPHFFEFQMGADLSASVTLLNSAGQPFSGPVSPGSTLVAKVTLSEAAGATAPITNITVDQDGLTVTPSTALTYVSGAPSGPLSLTPGQSTSYSVTYTTGSASRATLSVDATGTENGAPEQASASAVARMSQPLSVSVTFQQNGLDLGTNPYGLGANTIKLADDNDGEIAQPVQATVTITNVSQIKQDNVSFLGTPSVSFHDPEHATPPLPYGVTSGPTPATLPDLTPGASTSATFLLNVTNNGIADFTPYVQSTDDGTSVNNLSTGVGTLTALPTAILWLTLKAPPALQSLIPAGTGGELVGTLTNRSLLNSVDVTPIVPDLSGNVGGGIIQDTSQGPQPDGVQLAFTGTLKPGEQIPVIANIATSAVAGTRGTLTYEPAGQLINDDGSQTVLSGDQLGESIGSSTSGTSNSISIHIDTSDPPVPPLSDQSVVGSFTEAAMLNSVKWMAGNLQAGANLITSGNLLSAIGGGVGGAARGLAKVIVAGAQDAKEAAYFLSAMLALKTAWSALTPSDRRAFIVGIAQDFAASNLAQEFQSLNLTVQAISQKLTAGLDTFFAKLESGDYQGAAKMAGTGFSDVGDAALTAYLGNLALQKLALGMSAGASAAGQGAKTALQGALARAITLEDALRDANATTTLGKGVAAIAAGQNLLADGGAAAYRYFGVDPEMLAALRKFCEENKLIVAVRTRSTTAADLIKKGLAVGKNEAIKLKNVNEIDVQFLGYQAHDINTVVWAEPISRSEVLAEIKGLSQTEQETVLARYDLRVKEWNNAGYRKKLDTAEKTGFIDWDFNGQSNGAPIVRKQRRRFALHKTTPKGGDPERFYAKVLVGQKPGKLARLVPVTQDVDMMALLNANGSLLAPELRAKAYAYLSDILGIEHGETPSWLSGDKNWLQEGEIIFQAKAKQLAETIPGGEPLLIAGPDGSVRAGFYDPALTIFDKVSKTGYIIFKGGYNNPFAKAITRIVSKLKGFTS